MQFFWGITFHKIFQQLLQYQLWLPSATLPFMVFGYQSINSGNIFKYSIGDTMIQCNTNRLKRYDLNMVFSNLSLEANEVEIFTGKKVMVFWHEYQTKGKSRQIFIFITGKATSALLTLPTNEKLAKWEDKCVPLKRLLRSGSWGHEDGHMISSSGSSP